MRIITSQTPNALAKVFDDAAAARDCVVNDGISAVLAYPNARQLEPDYRRLQRFLKNYYEFARDPNDIDEPRVMVLVSGPQKKIAFAFDETRSRPVSRNEAEHLFGKILISQAIKISNAFPEFDPIIWRLYVGYRGDVIGRPHFDNGLHRGRSLEKMERILKNFGVDTRLILNRQSGALSATIAFGDLGTVLYPTTRDMMVKTVSRGIDGWHLYAGAQTSSMYGPCMAVGEGDVSIMRAVAGWKDIPDKTPQIHAPYIHDIDDDPQITPRGPRISAVDFSLIKP